MIFFKSTITLKEYIKPTMVCFLLVIKFFIANNDILNFLFNSRESIIVLIISSSICIPLVVVENVTPSFFNVAFFYSNFLYCLFLLNEPLIRNLLRVSINMLLNVFRSSLKLSCLLKSKILSLIILFRGTSWSNYLTKRCHCNAKCRWHLCII